MSNDGRSYADYLITDGPIPPRASGEMPEHPHPEPGGTVFLNTIEDEWWASWQNGPGCLDKMGLTWDEAVAWAREQPAGQILVFSAAAGDFVSLADYEHDLP